MTRAAESSADRKGAEGRRFPKSHRLKHRRLIRSLFDRDDPEVRHAAVGSIRAVFRVVPSPDVPAGAAAVQTAFFVGRSAGNAVTRNRIRRRMRETYRMVQSELFDIMANRTDALILGLVFRGSGRESGEQIAEDIAKALDTLKKCLTSTSRGEKRALTGSR